MLCIKLYLFCVISVLIRIQNVNNARIGNILTFLRLLGQRGARIIYKNTYGVDHFGNTTDPIKLKVSIYDNVDQLYGMTVPVLPNFVSLLTDKQIYVFSLIIPYKL